MLAAIVISLICTLLLRPQVESVAVFQRVICEEELFRHLFLSQSASALSTFPLCIEADEVNDGDEVVKVQEVNISRSEFEKLLREKQLAALKFEVSLSVMQLLGVSEKDQTITLALRLQLRWNDCRLAWSRPEFHMVQNITIPASRFAQSNIFVPSAILLEETSATASSGSEMQANVNWTGGVVLTKQYTTTISCNFDLSMYPFDSHMCNLTFETPFNSLEVNLTYWLWEPLAESRYLLGDGQFIPSDTWELIIFPPEKTRNWICVGLPQGASVLDVPQCYLDRQTFRLLLRRHPDYQVINLLIPAFLCLIVAASIFVIAPGQTDKVFLQLAILTSMFMFMNMMYSKMPESGFTLPWISRYYLINIVLLCANCMFAAVTTTISAVDFPLPQLLAKTIQFCQPIMIDMIPSRKRKIRKESNRAKSSEVNGSETNPQQAPADDGRVEITWRHVGAFIDRVYFLLQIVLNVAMVIIFVVVGYYPPNGRYGGMVRPQDWPYINAQLAMQGDCE